MPTDFVQIGSITISRVVFDVFTIILSVITGGLVTYLTTRAIENQKWKQQKKDKQQEQYREALALALDWIAPIDTALIRVESLSSAFIWNRITEAEFRQRWPDLLNDLSRLDRAMPAKLKVLLPENIYSGLKIVNSIDELYTHLLLTEHRAQISGDAFVERIKNARDQIVVIKKLSEDYKNLLVDEYKNTYK
jgi:hypothetical protein